MAVTTLRPTLATPTPLVLPVIAVHIEVPNEAAITPPEYPPSSISAELAETPDAPARVVMKATIMDTTTESPEALVKVCVIEAASDATTESALEFPVVSAVEAVMAITVEAPKEAASVSVAPPEPMSSTSALLAEVPLESEPIAQMLAELFAAAESPVLDAVDVAKPTADAPVLESPLDAPKDKAKAAPVEAALESPAEAPSVDPIKAASEVSADCPTISPTVPIT